MKKNELFYEAPELEVLEMELEGVACYSATGEDGDGDEG